MPEQWTLVDRGSRLPVAERVELADSFWSRLWGWQFRSRPESGQGLILIPCSSIHTCCLRFPIDVVFLDNTGRVLGLRGGVRPWRMVLAPQGTHAVLELPGGTASASIGDSITVRLQTREVPATVPKSLRFLGVDAQSARATSPGAVGG
jgi:hypothetical protein